MDSVWSWIRRGTDRITAECTESVGSQPGSLFSFVPEVQQGLVRVCCCRSISASAFYDMHP